MIVSLLYGSARTLLSIPGSHAAPGHHHGRRATGAATRERAAAPVSSRDQKPQWATTTGSSPSLQPGIR